MASASWGERSGVGVLRFTWTTLWFVEMPPLAPHSERAARLHPRCSCLKTGVGEMLSWGIPVSLPSRRHQRDRLIVAGWWPTIEYICAG